MGQLSHRQLSVLRLYALGLTRIQIGRELFISQHTVKAHLVQIAEILGAENSVHAVTICLARGYLCVDGRGDVIAVYIPRPIDDLIEI